MTPLARGRIASEPLAPASSTKRVKLSTDDLQSIAIMILGVAIMLQSIAFCINLAKQHRKIR